MAGDLISREYLLGEIGKMPVAWEYGKAVEDISRDFEDTLEKCREVTEYYKSGRSAVLRGTQRLLMLFAPLL